MSEDKILGKGLDAKLKARVYAIYSWYSAHLKGMIDSQRVYLLTDGVKSKQDYQKLLPGELSKGILTMEDFIIMNKDKHPELANFMGFADEMDI